LAYVLRIGNPVSTSVRDPVQVHAGKDGTSRHRATRRRNG
jgi:hypothetical protein